MKLLRNIVIGGLAAVGALLIFLALSVIFDSFGDEAKLAELTNVRIENPAGPSVAAYVAAPTEDGQYPAVIMLHEFWGMRPSITGKADLLAEAGYVVIAPDTYRGAVTNWIPRAIYLSLSTPQERVNQDLDAVYAWLADQPNVDPANIMVMGFCYGGGKALRYSLHNPDIASTGVFYGELMDDPAVLVDLPGPVLGIFGAEDQRPAPEEVAAFEMALVAADVPNEITIYDGVGHAFVEDAAGIAQGGAQGAAWAQFVNFANATLKAE